MTANFTSIGTFLAKKTLSHFRQLCGNPVFFHLTLETMYRDTSWLLGPFSRVEIYDLRCFPLSYLPNPLLLFLSIYLRPCRSRDRSSLVFFFRVWFCYCIPIVTFFRKKILNFVFLKVNFRGLGLEIKQTRPYDYFEFLFNA